MTLQRPMFPPRADAAGERSPDRRTFLTQAAFVASGSAALGLALPLPAPAIATPADPVFAAIELFKVLSIEYTAAVDWRAPMEEEDPDLSEAEDEASRTCAALFEQRDMLFSYRPATAAGIAALLNYIATLEDWQMPAGLEETNGMQAVQKLCTCLAASVERIEVAA